MGIGISSTGGGYTKKAADAKFAAKNSVLPLSGGTLTGNVTVSSNNINYNTLNQYGIVSVEITSSFAGTATLVRTGISNNRPSFSYYTPEYTHGLYWNSTQWEYTINGGLVATLSSSNLAQGTWSDYGTSTLNVTYGQLDYITAQEAQNSYVGLYTGGTVDAGIQANSFATNATWDGSGQSMTLSQNTISITPDGSNFTTITHNQINFPNSWLINGGTTFGEGFSISRNGEPDFEGLELTGSGDAIVRSLDGIGASTNNITISPDNQKISITFEASEVANSDQWRSTYTTVCANSATWGAGGGGGVDTGVRALTGNWQSTYTTVQSNSGSWGGGGGINLNTVTNYLSTNNVLLSSATVSNTLTISSVQIRSLRGTAAGPNLFIGDSTTGRDAATGNHNLVFGLSAGNALTTGGFNVFIGSCAGRANTTGFSNIFIGSCAGFGNTTGTNNNFLGILAGRCNTTGDNNNFLGNSAGTYNTTGCNNNFLGSSAGQCNTSGCNNNMFGPLAGYCNSTGCHNNFFGFCAGRFNTGGTSNNFFGCEAGRCNTTGGNNNFLGIGAGANNTTGIGNNMFGNSAGYGTTTGSFNNFLGGGAGFCNTTGDNNNFLGSDAGKCNTSGCDNNFFGQSAGYFSTVASNNNFIGRCAGCSNTSGANNNFLGFRAGVGNSAGSNNVIIGTCANVGSISLSGVIVLGNNAVATESHQIVLSSQNVIFRNLSNTFNIGASNQPNNLTVFGTISSNNIVYAQQVGPIGLSAIQQTFATITLNEASELLTINNPVSSVIIIPADSTTNFQNGSQVNLSRIGAGTVTVSASPGVFLRSADNKKQLRVQYSTATVLKLSANDWLLFGDIV